MNKLWGALFGIVMLAAALLFVVSPVFGWWLPKDVSTYGWGIDVLFYLILAITGFFFILTEAILVYNLFKFGGEPGRPSAFVHGSHKLEMYWTLVPGVILFLLALVQIKSWAEIKYNTSMPRPTKDVQQIEVQARQWEWRLRYPSPGRWEEWQANEGLAKGFAGDPREDDVRLVNEVHVYPGAKVLVHLKTRDVLHSFFLPNLRIKQDAVPGKTIPLWFEVTESNCARRPGGDRWVDGYDPKTGQFGQADRIWELACAEFCGSRHSMMRGKLYVHADRKDFEEWLWAAHREQQARQPAGAAENR